MPKERLSRLPGCGPTGTLIGPEGLVAGAAGSGEARSTGPLPEGNDGPGEGGTMSSALVPGAPGAGTSGRGGGSGTEAGTSGRGRGRGTAAADGADAIGAAGGAEFPVIIVGGMPRIADMISGLSKASRNPMSFSPSSPHAARPNSMRGLLRLFLWAVLAICADLRVARS